MKTSELIRGALDWAVALAQGYDEGWLHRQMRNPNPKTRGIPAYSSDWEKGGPIIESEGISITRLNPLYFPKGNEAGDFYEDHVKAQFGDIVQYGPTLLIAAMRCYVAFKLGNEVEVPEELI